MRMIIQKFWAVDEGVAVQAAEPCELSLFQPRNGSEQLYLCAVFHLGLKPDHVIKRAQFIVLTQLNNSISLLVCPGVHQANRLHRAKT